MEERQPRKSVREEFAEKFINILESERPLEWVKGWAANRVSMPYNGQTGRRYHGINRFVLMLKALEKKWTDPRFYTFHQVSGMDGCKVRANEKATAVEYWLIWDTKDKRSMTLSEYEHLLKDDPTRKEEEFSLYAKAAYVFSASQIEGVQLLPQPERNAFAEDRLAEEVIKTMSDNMGVNIYYGGDEAYYDSKQDRIQLPPKEAFYSANEYYGTALHELSHSTSAPNRLNRPIGGYHTDRDSYAIEELRAEISSVYVCAELEIDMPESAVQNNLAYVQSWLSHIKEDHTILFSAIKDADKIADYMLDQGRVEVLREKLETEAKMPKRLSGIYEIWQLKDMPENHALLFSDYDCASMFRLTESRYDKVYEKPITAEVDSLEKIYYKFNVSHPKDFKGHSLSMSDVIVLNMDGKRTGWYCDRIGFKEIEGFCKMQQPIERKGRTR